MKRISFVLIMLITIFYSFNVNAKDTIVSMNKYEEERFTSIINGYDTEGKIDGLITGGYVLKEKLSVDDNEYNDYQAIVAKYIDNKLIWKYTYGKTKEDFLDCLNYSYDTEGKIDGYLLTVIETSDFNEESTNETIFIKLSLDGNEISQKQLSIGGQIRINKLITTYDGESNIDGYIATGNNDRTSYLIKLDKDLNVVWLREFPNEGVPNINFLDLSLVTKDKQIVGYAVIKEVIDGSNNKNIELLRYDITGENYSVITDLNKYDSYSLAEATDGFIVYGATSEVKLDKGDESYYLINYNSLNEDYWETIGESPLDKNKKVILLPIKKDKQIKEYLLLYSNNVDQSTEVVKISIEGEIKDKIKKIYDEYHSIEDFNFSNDILYLVGQVNCPKDDSCAYDSKSLYLISEEEKVIEVKDNDSKSVLIIIGVFFVLLIGIIFYKRKRKMVV